MEVPCVKRNALFAVHGLTAAQLMQAIDKLRAVGRLDTALRDNEVRVVVITGASMGIGEAIAKLFVDEGARVVLLSRDAGRAEAARGEQALVPAIGAYEQDMRDYVYPFMRMTMEHDKQFGGGALEGR